MTDIQIERVPLPSCPAHGRPNKYPYYDLRIGDSFFVTRAHLNISTWSKMTGFKFTQRRVRENGRDGLRVWRVS